MAAKQLKASIIIDMSGNITGKAEQFGGAIDRMEKRTSSSLNRMKTNVRYLSDGIDKLTTRTVIGVIAAGTAIDKTFVKTAAMFERFQIQTTSLFGGPTQGKQAMNWAKQNAKDTVLSLQEVMQMMTEMKGFGMNPMDGKLSTMENVAAQHGWQFDQLHGAMTQIEQMYSKQKIGADDAKILSAYGVNIYQELSRATGISQKRIMQMGTKGLLGNKALEVFFKQLDSESKGASASAMKTWDGLISNLGDDWEQWEENVMNRGVFDKLKNKAREMKAFVENPDKANASAHDTAAILNHSIDMATAGAEGLWSVFKGIGSTIDTTSGVLGDWAVKLGLADDKAKSADKTLTGIKILVESIAALYLGKKAYDLGKPVVKTGAVLASGGWSAGKALFKGSRWLFRKIFGGGRPEVGGVIPPLDEGVIPKGVQRVFVTNWPRGMSGGGGSDGFGTDYGNNEKGKGKKSRRKKGPGKGRSRFSRILNAGEEVLEDAEHVGGKTGIWGKTKTLFKSAGRWGKKIPWLGTAFLAADVATADNNTERGGAVGSNAGAWVGGALGSLTDEVTGPFGTIVGAEIGQSIGDKLGSLLGSWFDDGKKDDAPAQQPLNGNINLNLNLPQGVTLASSMMSFAGGSPINLTTGGYIP
ncbi:tape measure protein [Rahnella contaminans]|uniref:tape measure protein n=1 Tax=Rahnella contaminans TaxID=2703882 RepID=UPI003C2B4675